MELNSSKSNDVPNIAIILCKDHDSFISKLREIKSIKFKNIPHYPRSGFSKLFTFFNLFIIFIKIFLEKYYLEQQKLIKEYVV